MRWLPVLAVVGVVGLAGCSTSTGAAPATSRPVPPPTTSSAPQKLTFVDVKPRLVQAILDDGAFAGQGLVATTGAKDSSNPGPLVLTCDIGVNSHDVGSEFKTWNDKNRNITLIQTVDYFNGESGAAAVDTVRQELTCGKYTQTNSSDGSTSSWTVTGQVTVPQAAGVDGQYAYCEENRDPAVIWACTVLLARGGYVGTGLAIAESRSTAISVLTGATPRLAAALPQA